MLGAFDLADKSRNRVWGFILVLLGALLLLARRKTLLTEGMDSAALIVACSTSWIISGAVFLFNLNAWLISLAATTQILFFFIRISIDKPFES